MNSENHTQTSRTIFRKEAIDNLSNKQFGTVLLERPFSFSVLTVFFVFLVGMLICFFIFFSTTRKAHTTGLLVPDKGVIKVVSIQSGTVIEKRVREGQRVKTGDVLYILKSERHLEQEGDDNERRGQLPRATQLAISGILRDRRESFDIELQQSVLLNQERKAALQRRAEDLKGDLQNIDRQLVLQKERMELSERNVNRYRELQKTNFISAAQLQDREADFIDQQQRLTDLQRTKASTRRELDATESEFRATSLASARERTQLRRSVASVDQELIDNETRREFAVVASQNGVVAAAIAEPGQTIGVNQPLASILPENSQLEAEVYAPSRAIGFLKPGMRVLIRYHAYPYQKFGQHQATVREVSNTTLRPEELAMSSVSNGNNEPVYRIRLTLAKQDVLAYGEALPLKSGMQLDASILLEERRLYEWILEPLFSISGRL